MRRIVVAGLASIFMLLAGCGGSSPPTKAASSDDVAPTVGGSPTSAASSPSASASTDANQSIQQYFRAFAINNPDNFRRVARQVTVPGSLAAAYAIHQAGGFDAAIDGGSPFPPDTVTSNSDGSQKTCSTGEDGTVQCTTYGNYAVDAQGRLASFTVNRKSIKDRIVLGNGSAQSTPLGNVTLISAYITKTGELSVVVKVKTNGTKVIFAQNGTTYRAPSGRQRNVEDGRLGPYEVDAHSLAHENLYFPGPLKLGGTVTIDMTQDGGTYSQSFVKLKVG